MEKEELKFVIVGHVDHGKSTLIGRLLYDTGSLPEGKIEEIRKICESLGKDLEFGYVMDNLEEERDQGITIDTAQIFFRTACRDYVIIDAPGHVEFLRNMITGASQADAAVLIVDAAEGVKEQTKRHAYILRLIGIDRVLVAVNKMDLVGYDQSVFRKVSGELAGFLGVLGIHPAGFIPMSARHGDNVFRDSGCMPWYEGPTLLAALDNILSPGSAKDGPLRFAVQDVYNYDRRIYAGRVESGTLRVGETIAVLPTMGVTKVLSIEEFQRESGEAEAGKAIGVTIEDKLFIDRGYVLARATDLPAVTDTIEASLFWMEGTAGKKDETYTLRCATQEVPCRIASIRQSMNTATLEVIGQDLDEVKNREVAEVTIKTLRPVVVDPFSKVRELGRFVLSRENTVAGGIIRRVHP
jgi:sulfate adenylyltransferase large subunit